MMCYDCKMIVNFIFSSHKLYLIDRVRWRGVVKVNICSLVVHNTCIPNTYSLFIALKTEIHTVITYPATHSSQFIFQGEDC